ncbi:MAG: B12-binding domain-containing protein [Acidimicrobiales bacterium]
MTSAEALDLQTAADRLGVHYQTAYRWARSGVLEASLVAGRYRIDPDALSRFAATRSRPTRPSPRRPRDGFERLRDRLHAQLVGNEERAARRLVADLLRDGVSVTTTIEEVIAPVMRRIGENWAAGRTTIAEEHQASAIVERVLAANLPSPRGRRRGVAVVAAPSGDRHALPTLMAAAALREDNWRVRHLGSDLPGDELSRLCAAEAVDLVVLTVTNAEALEAAARAAATLEQLGTPVLIGHPGASLNELQRLARRSRLRS